MILVRRSVDASTRLFDALRGLSTESTRCGRTLLTSLPGDADSTVLILFFGLPYFINLCLAKLDDNWVLTSRHRNVLLSHSAYKSVTPRYFFWALSIYFSFLQQYVSCYL